MEDIRVKEKKCQLEVGGTVESQFKFKALKLTDMMMINVDHFKMHMMAPTTIKLIKEIENCIDNEKYSSDEILEKNNFVYTYNAQNRVKNYKNKKRNKPRNKWYDQSCYELNRKMKSIARLCQNSPGNNEIRRNLNIIKKQYKNLLKFKKNEWTKKVYKELDMSESENPKKYWNIIKDIRDNKIINNMDNLQEFENYYRNLFSKHNIEEHKYKEVNELIGQMLKKQFNTVEINFNMEEFNNALKK